jgi:UDP-N-acetylmuramoyl-L-alanyl-D-glutamate--2,6-diaminopimelate ligase
VKTLDDILPGAAQGRDGARRLTGLACDSRAVKPGFVFFAVPGSRTDGLAYVCAAAAQGAVAVVAEAERPADLPAAIAFVRVPDIRLALAQAASHWHQAQPEIVLAVTGTSGKTSVVDFTRQILSRLGRNAASLGTIGVVASGGARYGALTTPDPLTLHATLAALAADGVTHLAMEASSHGLDQRRLDGVRLSAAGFTNLGRDHLDYHATIEDYLAAKLRLFTRLLPDGAPAVVNADGAFADRVTAAVLARGLPLLSVGRAGADLTLEELTRQGFDQMLSIRFGGRRHAVRLPLAGAFQAENALVAAGLAIACGEDAGQVLAALSHLSGVKGRLERVGQSRGGLVVVDYAHKPDALGHALDALRPFATGRLVCIIGCGGDRDRGKRPLMGAIAAQKADAVIVTDDNPRTENPAAIRAAILAAAPGAREIADRGEAIRTAILALGEGDVVLIAGKGHETGQIVGDRVLAFSDHAAAESALAEAAA